MRDLSDREITDYFLKHAPEVRYVLERNRKQAEVDLKKHLKRIDKLIKIFVNYYTYKGLTKDQIKFVFLEPLYSKLEYKYIGWLDELIKRQEMFTTTTKNDGWQNFIPQAQEMDVRVVCAMLGIEVGKKPILCPFHEEKTPSFHVREKNFKCFGCGEGGNAVTLVMKYLDLNFIESIKWLHERS